MDAGIEKVRALMAGRQVRRGSKLGEIFAGAGVARSREFLRILALPRRTWQDDPGLTTLAARMTAILKTPTGTMILWPVQAVALLEAAQLGGLFAPLAVGKGKALVSVLAATVIDCERPALFVPASLAEQTRRVIARLSAHWQIRPDLAVIPYSWLSLARHDNLLNDLRPDLLIFDEAHYLKHVKAARTRRVARYIKESGARVVALSGTMTRRSIRDFARLATWALGASAPVPAHYHDIQEWADALDLDVPEERRIAPGALKDLCLVCESPRDGFRRRLVESPGVVASGQDELPVSLEINALEPRVPGKVAAALKLLADKWQLPDGQDLCETLETWRHGRELALGFWYKWQTQPPASWLEARRAWKGYVRRQLSKGQAGLDSELQVVQACRLGMSALCREYSAWFAIKDTFKPITVETWIDDFAISEAAAWLKEYQGIAWVEQIAFGRRLAEVSGYPYFGAGDDGILDATGPLIASISAHAEGKNLQAWDCNLVTSPPASGKTWDQLLGRTHRFGQQSDTVRVWVMLHAAAQSESFRAALAEARYIEDTLGTRQKLLYADYSFDVAKVGMVPVGVAR